MEENQIYPQAPIENTNNEPMAAPVQSEPAVTSIPPIPLVPQESPVTQKPYAKFVIRWAASVIDGILSTLLSLPLLFVFFALGFDKQSTLVNLTSAVVIAGYGVFFIAKYQATPGKRFFRIKVQSEDDNHMTWIKAFLREVVGKFISSIVLMLGYLWAAFDKKKQTWHDKIAGTVVIQDEPLSKGKKILAYGIALGLPVLAVLGIAAVVALVAINPVEQLARTRDAGRKSAVSQLGHAVQAYYQTNNAFPEMINNLWITKLVSSGELSSVPSSITNTIGSDLMCALSAAVQNGFCYESSHNNAVVYTPFESSAEKNKCFSGQVAWSVYSTVDGSSGTVCTLFGSYPQPGPQKFVD